MMTRFNFFLALAAAIWGPLYFPHLHLVYFAPYLVSCFYRYERYGVLWRAFGCGMIIDLLSSTPLFGMVALSYCLGVMLLYGQKRNFFEDKLFTLPLMSFLFAFVASGVLAMLFVVFGGKYVLSWRWVVTDLCEMPVLDGLYALLFQFTGKLFRMKWYDRFRKRYRRKAL